MKKQKKDQKEKYQEDLMKDGQMEEGSIGKENKSLYTRLKGLMIRKADSKNKKYSESPKEKSEYKQASTMKQCRGKEGTKSLDFGYSKSRLSVDSLNLQPLNTLTVNRPKTNNKPPSRRHLEKMYSTSSINDNSILLRTQTRSFVMEGSSSSTDSKQFHQNCSSMNLLNKETAHDSLLTKMNDLSKEKKKVFGSKNKSLEDTVDSKKRICMRSRLKTDGSFNDINYRSLELDINKYTEHKKPTLDKSVYSKNDASVFQSCQKKNVLVKLRCRTEGSASIDLTDLSNNAPEITSASCSDIGKLEEKVSLEHLEGVTHLLPSPSLLRPRNKKRPPSREHLNLWSSNSDISQYEGEDLTFKNPNGGEEDLTPDVRRGLAKNTSREAKAKTSYLPAERGDQMGLNFTNELNSKIGMKKKPLLSNRPTSMVIPELSNVLKKFQKN